MITRICMITEHDPNEIRVRFEHEDHDYEDVVLKENSTSPLVQENRLRVFKHELGQKLLDILESQQSIGE